MLRVVARLLRGHPQRTKERPLAAPESEPLQGTRRMTLQQTLTAAVRVSLIHMQSCLGDDTSVPGCKPSFLAGIYPSSVLPRPATLLSLPINTSDNLPCHQGINIRSQTIRIARVWPSSYKTTAAMKPQRKQQSEDDRPGPPVR